MMTLFILLKRISSGFQRMPHRRTNIPKEHSMFILIDDWWKLYESAHVSTAYHRLRMPLVNRIHIRGGIR